MGKCTVAMLIAACLISTVYTASVDLTDQPYAQCTDGCQRTYNTFWSKLLHGSPAGSKVEEKDEQQSPVKTGNMCKNITSYIECNRKCKAQTSEQTAAQNKFFEEMEDYQKICPSADGKNLLECLTDTAFANMKEKCMANEQDFLKAMNTKTTTETDTKPVCRLASVYVMCIAENMADYCGYEESENLLKVFFKTIKDLIRGADKNKETDLDPSCDMFFKNHDSEVEKLMTNIAKFNSMKMAEMNKLSNAFTPRMHPKEVEQKEATESPQKHDYENEDSSSSALSATSFLLSIALSVALALLFHH